MKLTRVETHNKNFFNTPKQLEHYSKKNELMYPEKELFDKYIDSSSAVLDIGCGEGRTTEYISERCRKVIGIDIAEEMIVLAKKKSPFIKYQVMNACELDFPDNYFDVIVFSYNGLDYIYPEAKRVLAIKEIYRTLKNNGLFIYSSHNKNSRISSLHSIINLLINFLTLKLFSKYHLDIHKSGILYQYSTSPREEIKNLGKMGFKNLEILSINKKNKTLPERESWTYYVFKK